MDQLFSRFASKCAHWMGNPWAFIFAFSLVVGWAISGPIFKYSDSWELVINTATTIITFLMVFLIQNTQNRDARAMHLKINEVIFALRAADNKMLNIEDLSVEQLDKLAEKYKQLALHVESKKKERGHIHPHVDKRPPV